ncbi:MAG: TIGR02300 family protein [Sphingomonadales bacterium]
MVKSKWGTKRTCPKCSTRFYDLGNSTPCNCIDCGTSFKVEPILKEKHSHIIEAKAIVKDVKKSDPDVNNDDDLDTILLPDDDDDDLAKEDDSVLGDVSLDDDNDDVATVIDTVAVSSNNT